MTSYWNHSANRKVTLSHFKKKLSLKRTNAKTYSQNSMGLWFINTDSTKENHLKLLYNRSDSWLILQLVTLFRCLRPSIWHSSNSIRLRRKLKIQWIWNKAWCSPKWCNHRCTNLLDLITRMQGVKAKIWFSSRSDWLSNNEHKLSGRKKKWCRISTLYKIIQRSWRHKMMLIKR